MKRVFAVLLAVMLTAAGLCAAAEEEKKDIYFQGLPWQASGKAAIDQLIAKGLCTIYMAAPFGMRICHKNRSGAPPLPCRVMLR